MIYKAQKGRDIYGAPVGIIVMDCAIPYPPGTPGNPSSFGFPVLYEVVRGATMDSLIYTPDSRLAEPFLEAGRRLVAQGVRAVFGNCGFMVLFQERMAAALPVPVFMSSLLQLPLAARGLAPGQSVGIISASAASLTERHMEIALGGAEVAFHITGLENRPAFKAAVHDQSGALDFEAVEAEVVAAARDLIAAHPKIGTLLFECTDLPPYAHAVQQATGLPVFDISTLIGFGAASVMRRRFSGHY
ncbi:aspartate/glutamate racemase family protein [Defluviimonas sp. WL0075]|uniref:Aspartate/glutamate racemase family protein n=1 Tax=Albidovulum sediminicola TaxID=2984331 RepID=A0ABT2Z260_9RHOB|nr:aspartate/glutamate racemase family protein [Defluviimonas sp. WL0075]MCV2865173.1 aspartate/glutamate racemase family protein [Defluviimonas sp. WL0075]